MSTSTETQARRLYVARDTHLNYVGKGTKTFEGPVAPFQDQFHATFELTAGLTDHVSIGFMQLNARRPGNSLEYAGWRFLPHLYVPRSWHLPVDLGLVAEFSFQKTTYEENSRRIEVRPIVGKKSFGKLRVDFQSGIRAGAARTGNERRVEFRAGCASRVRGF